MSKIRKKSKELTKQIPQITGSTEDIQITQERQNEQEELKKIKPSTSFLTKGKRVSVDYRGVYLHYVSPDGSEKWRAHFYWYPLGKKLEKIPKDDIRRNKKSVQTIGYYDTAREAAEVYDEFVREHQLPFVLNFPTEEEKRQQELNSIKRDKISIKTQEFLAKHSEFVDYITLANIVNHDPHLVLLFLNRNNLPVIRDKSTVIIFDIRGNYEGSEEIKDD